MGCVISFKMILSQRKRKHLHRESIPSCFYSLNINDRSPIWCSWCSGPLQWIKLWLDSNCGHSSPGFIPLPSPNFLALSEFILRKAVSDFAMENLDSGFGSSLFKKLWRQTTHWIESKQARGKKWFMIGLWFSESRYPGVENWISKVVEFSWVVPFFHLMSSECHWPITMAVYVVIIGSHNIFSLIPPWTFQTQAKWARRLSKDTFSIRWVMGARLATCSSWNGLVCPMFLALVLTSRPTQPDKGSLGDHLASDEPQQWKSRGGRAGDSDTGNTG